MKYFFTQFWDCFNTEFGVKLLHSFYSADYISFSILAVLYTHLLLFFSASTSPTSSVFTIGPVILNFGHSYSICSPAFNQTWNYLLLREMCWPLNYDGIDPKSLFPFESWHVLTTSKYLYCLNYYHESILST